MAALNKRIIQIVKRIVNNADSIDIFIDFLISLLCYFIEKHVIYWVKFNKQNGTITWSS